MLLATLRPWIRPPSIVVVDEGRIRSPLASELDPPVPPPLTRGRGGEGQICQPLAVESHIATIVIGQRKGRAGNHARGRGQLGLPHAIGCAGDSEGRESGDEESEGRQ